jgi:hypothetical protein
LQQKKIVGENLTVAILADSLAQDLLSLPFWQKTRAACRFGSYISLAVVIMAADRIGWYNPPKEG